MKIQRKRYIITRNHRTEIFCGMARNYQFRNIELINHAPIKTYRSKNSALSGFDRSWSCPDFEIEVLEVLETIEC